MRAAVDNRRMTVSCGIDVDRLFALAFAIGSALAGFGGGARRGRCVGSGPDVRDSNTSCILLMVVVVGGLGSIRGTLVAALAARHLRRHREILRAAEPAPSFSTRVTVVMLLWRPHGLFGR